MLQVVRGKSAMAVLGRRLRAEEHRSIELSGVEEVSDAADFQLRDVCIRIVIPRHLPPPIRAEEVAVGTKERFMSVSQSDKPLQEEGEIEIGRAHV